MNIVQVTGGPQWARWVADGEPIYIAVSKYEEKDAVKAAGFRWNPEKRSWWTNSIDAAANLAEYASGELGDKLKALRMAKVKSLAQSRAAKSDFDVPHPEGLAYRPFQVAGIEYMGGRKNTLLTDDMGLGKTVQAIGFINANPEIRTVLIICPATLKGNWERELRRWLVRPMRIAIGDSTTCVMPEHGYDIVIQNYEAMRKHASVMASVKWDLLVCDEVHKCKNPKAQQTKAVQSIRAERILGMTGTPIVNRPVELYNLLVWLDKERWDKKWWWYVKRYCNATQTRYGLDVSGANKATLGELQNTLRETIMIRRLKADVLTELPPKQRQIIEIEPDGDAMVAVRQEGEFAAQYEERMEEFRASVELAKAGSEDGYREAVKRMQEAGSVMFGEMSKVRKATAMAKVPYVVDHLKELIDSVGKVVCFVHHHEVAHAIAKAFQLECMVLTGETKIEDRQGEVDRFQADPNCKLAVVSIMAGGVGITLTAASYAVFAELDWVPGNVTQAEDRCLEGNNLVFCLQSDYIHGMALKKIKNVSVGDVVLTHNGNLKKVVAKFERPHSGMMTSVRYVGWPEPLVCTSDHKVFVKREGQNQWVEACKLLPSDSMVFPKVRSYKRLDRVKIKPEWRLYQEAKVPKECSFDGCGEKVEARGLCRIHYRDLLSKKERPPKPPQINPRYKRLPDFIEITDDWLYLFGWYAAEGFSSLLPGKSKFISFSGHEKERFVLEKIVSTIGALGINCGTYNSKKTHGIEMRAYSGELALWFRDWFGHMAENMELPKEIMDIPPDQAAVFLRGYTDGDGYQRNRQVEWVSASEKMSFQICMLAIRAGFIPTMRRGSVASGSHWVGGYTKFSVNLDNKRLQEQDEFYIYRPIRSVITEESDTTVYDITVEDDHSFTTGLCTVHNCHRIGQVNSVNIQHIVLAGSIDVNLAKTIVDKQEIIEKALDLVPEPVVSTKSAPATDGVTVQQVAEQAALLSREEIVAIHECLKLLAADDHDHARFENGIGYNGCDSRIGHSLAKSFVLSAKQAVLGKKIVRKYRRQLQVELYEKIFGKE